MTSPLSLAEQIQVIHSRQDIAAWSLARLGLPAEWRDTNEPGNTARCQQAVDRLFTLTRAELEASLAAQNLVPEQLPHVETTRGSHDGAYFIALGRDRWVVCTSLPARTMGRSSPKCEHIGPWPP